jgi:hypothetical protein
LVFDLDGCLDRPTVSTLANALLNSGHELHVISGCFPLASWQDEEAKKKKLARLGLAALTLHVIDAIPVTAIHDLNYVLRDLGLRKGALCEELGIELFIDDSETYCSMIPRMSGGTTVLHVK